MEAQVVNAQSRPCEAVASYYPPDPMQPAAHLQLLRLHYCERDHVNTRHSPL